MNIPQQPNIELIKNRLYLKPEYLNHPEISGNKFRKLKYNLLEAKRLDKDTLLTFGGAFSNHISAVASAGEAFGFKTIGVIRGEELANKPKNDTLQLAQDKGMQLHFISREDYRKKTDSAFINQLKQQFGDFYLLPEGGTNALAIKGCMEILSETDTEFDYLCCPVGTGGTLSGIVNVTRPRQKVLGFLSLKGDFLSSEIHKFATKGNWKLNTDFHFGGYAKINEELVAFINQFKADYGIPLDPIYTGKMLYGIFKLMENGYFPKDSKILAIHTGGLQGIAGMNEVLKRKGMPLLLT